MRIYQPVAGPDRFPQAMVEGTTEYDWAELPDYLKDIMRKAAHEFTQWAEQQHHPIQGELANELPSPTGASHDANR